ncbi:MAG TPA: hypothetical protein PK760_16425, partial [Flavobacteriales bacterium]|nr:hypothetical protein [Flavobacteriales bacterium]
GGWTRTQMLASGQQGWSCIGEDSGLELYAGNNSSNTLWKLKEICTDTIPVVTSTADSLTSTPATGYRWDLNGTAISGATGQS